MPNILTKEEVEMPASPIRKLAPIGRCCQTERSSCVSPEISVSPTFPLRERHSNAIRNVDRTVLEYSPSQGYRSYREKLVGYYKKV